nr:hypothetical protein [uncultured Rhodoferax sp.]
MKISTKQNTVINALSLIVFTLLIVWPINGTTGLKNTLILSGAATSFYLLLTQPESIKNLINKKTTLILFFFSWIFIQSYLISPFPAQAQKQLTSVWLATVLAAFMGLTLGLKSKEKTSTLIISSGLLSLPFVYFVNYLKVCIENERFAIPVFNTDLGFYGDKTKIIFFGLIALATSLHLLFRSIQKKEHKTTIIFALLALASYMSFILVGSKSGVMQGAILFFLALSFVIQNHISKQISLALLSIGLLFGIAGVWQIKNDAGWANFMQSIQAGANIEKYDNWKNYPESGLPLVEGKYQTQESAYLRANGIVLGINCLISQPLGHGNLSEPLKRTQGTCELATQTKIFTTLSAILDFTLVIGIPGIIVFFAVFNAVFFSKKASDDDPLPLNKVLPVAIMLTWIFSEISDTHYYESTFFILSMLIGLGAPYKNTLLSPPRD